MKISKLIFPVLALGLIGFASTAIAMRGGAVKQVSAYGVGDYTPSNDHFIVSFHGSKISNQFGGSNKEGQILNNSSYVLDKTSSVEWKMSYGKNSTDTFAGLKLGNDADYTIKDNADADFAALYDKLELAEDHYVNAIYSTTAITNIQDVSVSWGASKGDMDSAGKLYIFYKLTTDGAQWTPILRNGDTKFHYSTGSKYQGSGTTSAWDWRRANPTVQKMSDSGVLGRDAQIAFVYDGGATTKKNNITLYTILVNRVASAKAIMHYLDKSGNDSEACSSLTDVNKRSKYYVYTAMIATNLEQIQIDGGTIGGQTVQGLNVAANFEYDKAKEATYYDQLAYFCSYAGIELNLVPTNPSKVLFITNSNDSAIVVVITCATATTIVATLFFLLKKKRHN